nr:immunoglobulin heavy chain junction region [Mus musculus]MBK4187852.1 immunoglobulin heavy chain junction region [Mus musculus]
CARLLRLYFDCW